MKNQYRPAWLAIGLLIPAMLVVVVFARDNDGVASERVFAGQVATDGQAQSSPQQTIAATAAESTSQGPLPQPGPTDVAVEVAQAAETPDEVTVLVEPATTTTAETTRTRPTSVRGQRSKSSPQTTASTTTIAPTTTSAPVEDLIGICVFSNGTIASSVRQSTCSGAFTLDPAEANRLAEELRGPTTTSTTTSIIAPTTTAPPTTTIATPPTTTSSSTTTTSTTVAVAPTTTIVDLTATTAPLLTPDA